MSHNETSHFSSIVHPVLTSTPSTTTTTSSLPNGLQHNDRNIVAVADSDESHTTPKLSSSSDTPDSGTYTHALCVNTLAWWCDFLEYYCGSLLCYVKIVLLIFL